MLWFLSELLFGSFSEMPLQCTSCMWKILSISFCWKSYLHSWALHLFIISTLFWYLYGEEAFQFFTLASVVFVVQVIGTQCMRPVCLWLYCSTRLWPFTRLSPLLRCVSGSLVFPLFIPSQVTFSFLAYLFLSLYHDAFSYL